MFGPVHGETLHFCEPLAFCGRLWFNRFHCGFPIPVSRSHVARTPRFESHAGRELRSPGIDRTFAPGCGHSGPIQEEETAAEISIRFFPFTCPRVGRTESCPPAG